VLCLPVQPDEMYRDEEFTELLSSQQKLEFHIDRTQTWLSHLGRWKAHILHADVRHLPLFVCCDYLILYVHQNVLVWLKLSDLWKLAIN